jgi:hypothetical protein
VAVLIGQLAKRKLSIKGVKDMLITRLERDNADKSAQPLEGLTKTVGQEKVTQKLYKGVLIETINRYHI